MTADEYANLAGAVSPLIAAVCVWMTQRLRSYVKSEIRPHLTNDHTSAASYARQARDMSEKALGVATTVDAHLGRVEAKLDGHILGGHSGPVA